MYIKGSVTSDYLMNEKIDIHVSKKGKGKEKSYYKAGNNGQPAFYNLCN